MKRTGKWIGCAVLGLIASVLLTGPAPWAQNTTNTNNAATSAPANENSSGPTLAQAASNPDNWASPSLNDAATRYSPLKQIDATNASHLQVAWTFSTGVLRGHEGQPLVIGNVMYLVTPFPNTVYALDLNNDERILWQYHPDPERRSDSGDVL